MRRVARPIGALAAAALALLAIATKAMADAEPAPIEAPSNTGAIVVVTLCVVAIALVSIVVLRGIARGRRERWTEEAPEARHGSPDAGAPPDAGADEPDLR